MTTQEVLQSEYDAPVPGAMSPEPLSPVWTGAQQSNCRERSRRRYNRVGGGLSTSRTFVLLSALLLLASTPFPHGRSRNSGAFSRFMAAAEDQQLDDYVEGDDIIADDIQYEDNFEVGFGDVSIMPVSCTNYYNGHLIKYELFENENNYQCHFKSLGQFIVSINSFMRAYFNYQVLLKGRNFNLPNDAAFLNCVMLQETAYSEQKLYAKIGCNLKNDAMTSTKLQLRVFTDKQCSVPYNDGQSDNAHANNGYIINGYSFSTRVSFRPAFYSCQSCSPAQISNSFSKSGTAWYDDDYITKNGKKRSFDDDYDADADADADDYFAAGDDNGFHYANNPNYDDKFYAYDDDDDDGALDMPPPKKAVIITNDSEEEEGKISAFLTDATNVLSTSQVRWLFTASFLRFCSGLCIGVWAAPYFRIAFPDDSTSYAVVNAFIVSLCGVTSGVVGGWTADRTGAAAVGAGYTENTGRLIVPIVGSVLAVPTWWLAVHSSSFESAMFWLGVEYLVAECWFGPVVAVLQSSVGPTLGGTAQGMFTLTGAIGNFAPSALGVLYGSAAAGAVEDGSALSGLLGVGVCGGYFLSAICFAISAQAGNEEEGGNIVLPEKQS
mmetsp:Transcript_41424/g.60605  ORF Transcript_41424/g.60605 Transcript_41424/m.60605 type:complete len:607 (+) Transcript_41424:177-1997(+)